MESSIIIIIVCIAMLAFAGYRIWKLIELSRRSSAGKTWPVVPGEVVSKHISERSDEESGTSYYPKVRYKYAVMGREYEKEITLHGIFNRNRAEKALSKIGDTIEVRYNPEKPEVNVTGQEKIALGDILFVIALVVFSFFLLIDIL